MKLSLSLNCYDKEERNEIADFISTELSLETKIIGYAIELTEPADFTQTEIFQMGVTYGVEKTKEKLNKPETFQLPVKYAKIFKQAINNYQKQSYIQVNSIDVDINDEHSMLATITIRPTNAHCFFGIVAEYGKLCTEVENIAI